jgi:hypothetical protein
MSGAKLQGFDRTLQQPIRATCNNAEHRLLIALPKIAQRLPHRGLPDC